MSDIKFACPHCRQHILCDSDYGGTQIHCPGCDGSLLVPKFPGGKKVSPAVVLMGTPLPAVKQVKTEQPGLNFWTEQEWEKNVLQHCGHFSGESRAWWVAAICTTILAALVAIHSRSWIPSIAVLVVGGLASLFLFPLSYGSGESRLTKAIFWVLAVLVGAPLLMLAFLFAACSQCK